MYFSNEKSPKNHLIDQKHYSGAMAQVVEFLLSKCEASTTTIKKKKRKTGLVEWLKLECLPSKRAALSSSPSTAEKKN
jgi:hypothetical protein